MQRNSGRKPNQLRQVKIIKNYIKHPQGSVLINVGNTKVICSASVEERVPSFLRDKKTGWLTAEYSMMPSSTHTRSSREASRGKLSGRTQEIQRLIGRSLRAIVDMKTLGERTVWIDCDVIQADGGTRCASITGAFVALCLALKKLKKQKIIKTIPIKEFVAAVSVGMYEGNAILDLDYSEDSKAEVDMNIIKTGTGKFIEIQGTAESEPFNQKQMKEMLSLADKGIQELIAIQKKAIGQI
jgi:ribonuclease PH|tara:strand:- start:82 stop:804 length:723 start_codon:yes stop_codon:yes gene_type:complete